MKKLFKAFVVAFAIATAFTSVSSGAFAALSDGITYTKARSAGKLTNYVDPVSGQRQKEYTYSATTTHTSGTRPSEIISKAFTGPNTGTPFVTNTAKPTTNNVTVIASRVANYGENETPPAVGSTHSVTRNGGTVIYRL